MWKRLGMLHVESFKQVAGSICLVRLSNLGATFSRWVRNERVDNHKLLSRPSCHLFVSSYSTVELDLTISTDIRQLKLSRFKKG